MTNKQRIEINKKAKLIANGDYKAIEDLYNLIGNKIFYVALKFTQNSSDAEDLTQDFWANIITTCSKIKKFSNSYGYFLKTVENLAKMWIRSNIKKQEVSLDYIKEYESTYKKIDYTERQVDLIHSFEKAIKNMTDEEHAVFVKVCYEDLTVREIAKQLNISKSKVHRLRKSALEKIKFVLENDGWDSDE